MNAGKSTSLLQSSYNYRERGMNTLVMTASIDDRYGKGKVAVSGPHPEAPESWKENAVDGDKMESNIHLAVGLVNELLSEKPVTHSK